MERELLLPVKYRNYNKAKVKNEIEAMKKILPYLESFSSFFYNNDVFNTSSHKQVKKSNRLKHDFDKGLENTSKYHVFCKN